MFDFLSLIFSGLQNPKAAAIQMAQMNVSPEEFKIQANNEAQKFQAQMQPQPQPQPTQFQEPDESALNWRQRIQQENQRIGVRDPGKYNLPNLGEIMGPQPQQPQVAPQMADPNTTPTTGRLPMASPMPMPMPDAGRFAGAAPAVVPPQMPPQGVMAPTMPVTPEGMDLPQMMQPQQAPVQAPSALPNPAQQASVGTTARPATMQGARKFANVNPELRAIISGAATKYGQDPNTLMTIAGIESSFNPNAKNPKSSASGLFQFIKGTAKDYGLADPFDAAQSSDAGARLLRDNRAYLVDKLGREPTPGELYLAHQQGRAGAEKLLTNADVRAVDLVGADQIKLNGGNENMSAGEFAGIWTNKFDSFAGGGSGATTATAAGDSAGKEIANVSDPTAASAPQSKAKTLADKLAEIGKSIEVPEGSGSETPMGSPSPPRPGNYNVNPETMRTMLAMLGPMMGGVQPIPTLAQLMSGRMGG